MPHPHSVMLGNSRYSRSAGPARYRFSGLPQAERKEEWLFAQQDATGAYPQNQLLFGRKVGVIPVILGLGYDAYVILILCNDRYDRYFLPLLRHWAVAAGEH